MTQGRPETLNGAGMVLAGFGGGMLSGAACAPMELCMIQQQRFGTSLASTPGAVVRQAGAMGLYRGYITSCLREGIFTAGARGRGEGQRRDGRKARRAAEPLATHSPRRHTPAPPAHSFRLFTPS